MAKFVISPHFRLQEWVAEEKGYFAQEGLDYESREAIATKDAKRQNPRRCSKTPSGGSPSAESSPKARWGRGSTKARSSRSRPNSPEGARAVQHHRRHPGSFQPSHAQRARPMISSLSFVESQGSSSVNIVTHCRHEIGMRVMSVPQNIRSGPKAS